MSWILGPLYCINNRRSSEVSHWSLDLERKLTQRKVDTRSFAVRLHVNWSLSITNKKHFRVSCSPWLVMTPGGPDPKHMMRANRHIHTREAENPTRMETIQVSSKQEVVFGALTDNVVSMEHPAKGQRWCALKGRQSSVRQHLEGLLRVFLTFSQAPSLFFSTLEATTE